MDIAIRPYASPEHDMPEIKRICCQAAFLGNPIWPIFKDTEWFADFMIAPYLTFEPVCTWVAEVDGLIVGYLTGSVEAPFGLLRGQFVIAKVVELYWRYVFGKYKDHPRSEVFARFVLTQALFQIPEHPDNTPHFHFNVDRDYRGMGIGSRLIAQFEKAIGEKGMHRYYAEVMATATPSPMARSEDDFIRMGYAIFDKKPTTVFWQEVDELNVLCIVRDCHSPAKAEAWQSDR